MKALKNIEKAYSPKEIAESLVFPGTDNPKEKEAVLGEFRDFRRGLVDAQSPESKTISRLLQLKFLMEDYLQADAFNRNLHFGYFLKEYIRRLEKKNKVFAEEIDIDTTELSQVINKHRKPTEKLIFRLEIHSNRNFPAALWFRLVEKERMHELLHDRRIIAKEEKHVKQKLEFSL